MFPELISRWTPVDPVHNKQTLVNNKANNYTKESISHNKQTLVNNKANNYTKECISHNKQTLVNNKANNCKGTYAYRHTQQFGPTRKWSGIGACQIQTLTVAAIGLGLG